MGAHARRVACEERGGSGAPAKLRAEAARVERVLVQAAEEGDAVQIAVKRVQRDVVQVVAPPGPVREAAAKRLHHPAPERARQPPEASALAVYDVARVAGE